MRRLVCGVRIFRLARDARILPETLTSLFTRLLVEEARHIVFFVNWIAWDRYRRGLRGAVLQAIPALWSLRRAIVRRVKGGAGDAARAARRRIARPLRRRAQRFSRRRVFCAPASRRTTATWRRSIRDCCAHASFPRSEGSRSRIVETIERVQRRLSEIGAAFERRATSVRMTEGEGDACER